MSSLHALMIRRALRSSTPSEAVIGTVTVELDGRRKRLSFFQPEPERTDTSEALSWLYRGIGGLVFSCGEDGVEPHRRLVNVSSTCRRGANLILSRLRSSLSAGDNGRDDVEEELEAGWKMARESRIKFTERTRLR